MILRRIGLLLLLLPTPQRALLPAAPLPLRSAAGRPPAAAFCRRRLDWSMTATIKNAAAAEGWSSGGEGGEGGDVGYGRCKGGGAKHATHATPNPTLQL